jgi:hypothetical protein
MILMRKFTLVNRLVDHIEKLRDLWLRDYQTLCTFNRGKTSVDCGIMQQRTPIEFPGFSGNVGRKSWTTISMLGNDPRWSTARSDEIMESFSAGIWTILETAVSFSASVPDSFPLTFGPSPGSSRVPVGPRALQKAPVNLLERAFGFVRVPIAAVNWL